jgi:hypothetical protein
MFVRTAQTAVSSMDSLKPNVFTVLKSGQMSAVSKKENKGVTSKTLNSSSLGSTPASVVPMKRKANEEAPADSVSDSNSEVDDADDDDAEDLPEGISFVDLPMKTKTSAKGGRPRNMLLDKLVQDCHYSNEAPTKRRYRCRTPGCKKSFAVRGTGRIYKHVTLGCKNVDRELRSAVVKQYIKKAPSKILKKLRAGNEVHASKRQKTEGRQKMEDGQALNAVEKMFEAGSRLSLEERKAQANLQFMILFAVHGLSPLLLDSSAWQKPISTISQGKYMTPSREKMENEYLPTEALVVQGKQIEILSRQNNLTLSFDGGTSRGREAFWLFHVSSGAEVYMVYGQEATDESHTGEWIKELAKKEVGTDNERVKLIILANQCCYQVLEIIKAARFAGCVSDSTGNTRLARELIYNEFKGIIILPDICHWLNLIIKDIVGLNHFKSVRAYLN